VAQVVEALRCKPEGRAFDRAWCHWNFSLTSSFRPHSDPRIDSASNRNAYQVYFLGRDNFPHSCVSCFEIWEPQRPGTPRTRNWPIQGLLYLLVCNIRHPTSLLFTLATCFQTSSVCVLIQVLRPSQVMDLPESPRKMTIDFRQA